jgi:hypothetical protein
VPFARAVLGAGGGATTIQFGDIHIAAQPGQDGRALADEFIDTLRRDPARRAKLEALATGRKRERKY